MPALPCPTLQITPTYAVHVAQVVLGLLVVLAVAGHLEADVAHLELVAAFEPQPPRNVHEAVAHEDDHEEQTVRVGQELDKV